MSLAKLEIFNVRNIVHAAIQPSPNLNLIYGENGSGKTSLLEAIAILGRAKSFRTADTRQAINFDADCLAVNGKSRQKTGNYLQVGIGIDKRNIQIKIAGKETDARSDLAYALPIQLILPNSQWLLESGPQIRREFMDWGIFYGEEKFLTAWRKYKRSVLQRNALLKAGEHQAIDVWEQEIAQYGTIVAEYRTTYVKELVPVFLSTAQRFLPFKSYDLQHTPGWDVDLGLTQVLQNERQKDAKYGYTQSGPHKADLRIMVNGRPAKAFVSRGQVKILVLSLKLAQVELLQNLFGNIGSILIDDLASELDELNRRKLFDYFSGLNAQVFVASTDRNLFPRTCRSDCSVFRLEHGSIHSSD